MAQIVITPQMLREAANKFNAGAQQIQEVLRGLQGAVAQVEGDWRGQSRQSFDAAWSQIYQSMSKAPPQCREVQQMLVAIAAAFEQAEAQAQAATRRSIA